MLTRRQVLGLAPASLLALPGLGSAREDLLSRCHDVRDFGARGDGVADDQPKLQAGLDRLAAEGGGTLYFSAGRYLLNQGVLRYGSNVRLVADGDAVIVNGTRKTAHQMLVPRGRGVTNLTVSGLVFDQRGDVYGNDGHSQCVSVEGVHGASLIGVEFRNVQTMAVWCETPGNEQTREIRIVGCRIRGSAAGGFSLFGNLRNSEIIGCDISDVMDDAIAVQDVPGSTGYPARIRIAGNVIRRANRRDRYGSAAHGILVFGGEDISVIDNDISDTVASGIGVQRGSARESARVTVARNRIRNAGISPDATAGVPGHGIYVHRSRSTTVIDNDIRDSRSSGLAATLSQVVTFMGNTAQQNGGAGVRIDAVSDAVILRNTLLNNGAREEPYGILVISAASPANSRKIRAYENRSGNADPSGSQMYGVYIAGSAEDATFMGNDLTGNKTAGRGGLITQSTRFMDNAGL